MGKEDNVKIHLTKKQLKGRKNREAIDRLLRAGFSLQVVPKDKLPASRFDRR